MKYFKSLWAPAALAAACAVVAACSGAGTTASTSNGPTNIIFFLGDGMGMTTMTAARIYAVGEAGELTMDTLPETAFIKTYSNDAQVTDSAPSMAAYMTGIKMNNEVVSMSADTMAYDKKSTSLAAYISGSDSTCPSSGNGSAVPTLLELAKGAGLATGVVSTTRITHATPAATYSHICHRDGENAIADQLTPSANAASKYNKLLGDGVDVILGGGLRHFIPKSTSGSSRTDERDLTQDFTASGYTFVKTKTDFDKVVASTTKKLVGLFTSSHMNYDLDRTTLNKDEPSLSDMTTKAIDMLKGNKKGMFLMVEGGRIDHALHETTARKALQDTVAFDNAIKTAIDKMSVIDPGLKNTLIVVTADHDHTLVMNGYAALTGKTSATNPGILGLLRSYIPGSDGSFPLGLDADGKNFTILGFGNGENRPAARTALVEADVFADTYHQEAAIPTTAGSETHGGADVFLAAIGKGAENFKGTLINTQVFGLIRGIFGL